MILSGGRLLSLPLLSFYILTAGGRFFFRFKSKILSIFWRIFAKSSAFGLAICILV